MLSGVRGTPIGSVHLPLALDVLGTGYERAWDVTRYHVYTHWGETPIAWPNMDFDPDEDVGNTDWIRVSFRPGESSKAEYGTDRNRYTGTLFFQIFIPMNTGSGRAMKLADQLERMMTHERVEGISFGTPSTTVVGRGAGRYWQMNVAFNYRRDDPPVGGG